MSKRQATTLLLCRSLRTSSPRFKSSHKTLRPPLPQRTRSRVRRQPRQPQVGCVNFSLRRPLPQERLSDLQAGLPRSARGQRVQGALAPVPAQTSPTMPSPTPAQAPVSTVPRVPHPRSVRRKATVRLAAVDLVPCPELARRLSPPHHQLPRAHSRVVSARPRALLCWYPAGELRDRAQEGAQSATRRTVIRLVLDRLRPAIGDL